MLRRAEATALAIYSCGWMLLLSISIAAHAASFDCNQAKTRQEKAICGSHELSAADDQMAAAYKAALAATPPEMIPEVRSNQLAWIRESRVQCWASASDPPAKMISCLGEYYKARTSMLQHMVAHKSDVTFVWRSITLTVPGQPGEGMYSYEANTGYGTLHASWPQTRGDTPEWKAWNAAMEEAAQKIAWQADGKPPREWLAILEAGVETDITTAIGIAGKRLVTATTDNQWDGHGVHPNETSAQLNWLLQEKRELRVEDIFRLGSGWDRTIQERCTDALQKQLGEDYETTYLGDRFPEVLHKIIQEPQNWQLDNKGLTVIFQTYSVSSHGDHADPVTISWDALRCFLQSSFVENELPDLLQTR